MRLRSTLERKPPPSTEHPPTPSHPIAKQISQVDASDVDTGCSRRARTQSKSHIPSEPGLVSIEPCATIVDERGEAQTQQVEQIVHQKNSVFECAPHASISGERVRSETARTDTMAQVDFP